MGPGGVRKAIRKTLRSMDLGAVAGGVVGSYDHQRLQPFGRIDRYGGWGLGVLTPVLVATIVPAPSALRRLSVGSLALVVRCWRP